MGPPIALALAAIAMVLAVFLFPFDSDASFATHDAIWYAIEAERAPARSINGHHPLFHVLVIGLVQPLRGMGIDAPGHVACRLVAGLGGAWLLLQICALAGRRRLLAGAAFALVLLCSRGFLVEIGTGENVLPAAAAALWALTTAARPAPSLVLTAAATTLAILLRQDNILIVPGVAAGVALCAAPGNRVGSVVRVLAGAGLATAAAYLVLWKIHCATPLMEWLFRFGLQGSWTGPNSFEWGRLGVYAFSVSLAMIGRQEMSGPEPPVNGLAWIAAMLVPAFLLWGRAPRVGLIVPIVLTLVARVLFHSWYEAGNMEWLVFPIALVLALGAGLAHGEPATPRVARIAGGAILVGVALAALAWHGRHTWSLRERRLMTAIEAGLGPEPLRWRAVAVGGRVHEGLTLLDLPHDTLSEVQEEVLPQLASLIAAAPVPMVVMGDPFAQDGMPFRKRDGAETPSDAASFPPDWEVLRSRGIIYGARWPAAATTSSSSRR